MTQSFVALGPDVPFLVNFNLRPDAVRVVGLEQLHVGVVETVVRADGRHFDALHEPQVIGPDRIELVEKVVGIAVRRAVAQRRHRIEIANCAARFLGRIDALRLVDDDDRVGGLNELDGPAARHAVVLAVDDVELLQLLLGHLRQVLVGNILLEGLDVDDHDLNLIAGRELPDLAETL